MSLEESVEGTDFSDCAGYCEVIDAADSSSAAPVRARDDDEEDEDEQYEDDDDEDDSDGPSGRVIETWIELPHSVTAGGLFVSLGCGQAGTIEAKFYAGARACVRDPAATGVVAASVGRTMACLPGAVAAAVCALRSGAPMHPLGCTLKVHAG